MIDLIKKAVLTGMGVISLTKEKIDEFSRELIDKGKLSEQEGEKFILEMRKRAEESKEALVRQTDRVVEASLAKMQLAKVADLEKLQSEIASLRKEIEALHTKE